MADTEDTEEECFMSSMERWRSLEGICGEGTDKYLPPWKDEERQVLLLTARDCECSGTRPYTDYSTGLQLRDLVENFARTHW